MNTTQDRKWNNIFLCHWLVCSCIGLTASEDCREPHRGSSCKLNALKCWKQRMKMRNVSQHSYCMRYSNIIWLSLCLIYFLCALVNKKTKTTARKIHTAVSLVKCYSKWLINCAHALRFQFWDSQLLAGIQQLIREMHHQHHRQPS